MGPPPNAHLNDTSVRHCKSRYFQNKVPANLWSSFSMLQGTKILASEFQPIGSQVGNRFDTFDIIILQQPHNAFDTWQTLLHIHTTPTTLKGRISKGVQSVTVSRFLLKRTVGRSERGRNYDEGTSPNLNFLEVQNPTMPFTPTSTSSSRYLPIPTSLFSSLSLIKCMGSK